MQDIAKGNKNTNIIKKKICKYKIWFEAFVISKIRILQSEVKTEILGFCWQKMLLKSKTKHEKLGNKFSVRQISFHWWNTIFRFVNILWTFW